MIQQANGGPVGPVPGPGEWPRWVARCAGRLAAVAEPDDRPLSALPSPGARVTAFVAILVAGLAGGMIGFALVRLQCEGDCALPMGIGAFSGAVIAAGGMSVVAVLVLRAIGEWREVEERERSTRR